MDFVTEADDLEKFSPSSDRRPFEVILRGGNPWGFTLSGGETEDTPLHISQIDDKSSAGNSALCVGDIVFSINGISCGSSAAAKQLIDSAFRTLTLKVLRGGWDPHRVPLSQTSSLTSAPERGAQHTDGRPKSRLAHDDSALYAHSKASQQSRPAMKPARRRGDSFHVSKTKPVPSSASSAPTWISNNDQPAPGLAPRSSYPDAFVHQRQLTVKDRRYSDAYPKLQHRSERHMVPSKSSPNLKKAESQGSLEQERETALSPSVKSVKSSPNIPEEVEKESWSYLGRSPLREEQILTRSAGDYGWGGFNSCDDPNIRDKIYSEDMYTTDMIAGNEAKVLPSQALHKYEADYENVALLGTAPLQSEKISEIDDIEDASDSEAPEVPPRPSYVDSENPDSFPPAPPVRDPSSLKYIRVNQNHEKYPSWPVTQPNAVSNHSQPINTRAQSWTDHTNTGKEFPSKQRLAYTPGLRPLPEKSPSTSESKGDDSSGKARNSSDPGFKSEFVYDKYGRVVQRKKGDKSGRFEEFYHNSKPGYPPPKLDSDGHNFGDKEYSAPSPPERDMAGIDQQALSQVLLGTMSDKRPPIRLHRPHTQLKEVQGQSTMYSSAQQQVPQPLCPVGPVASNRGISASHPYSAHLEGRRPAFHSMPAATSQADHSRRVDMATSPLKGPHETFSSIGDYPKGSSGMLSAAVTEKESVQSGSRYASKAYIVRQTPYYNTSTQTDVQSYAVKIADPNARQCNVEIQVGEYGCQTSPRKEFEEKSIQARMSREFQPTDLDSSQERHAEESHKKGYFRFQFEGIQSIKDKYATDEDSAHVPELPVFSHFNKGSDDQASIMRKLSEEFYGNKLGLASDKRHSSASSQEHSPKFMDSFHSGTMSQAESYTSVVIHPSESSAPFGRDDFGSQLSITDSKQDLSSLASSSKSSLRDLAPRGRGSFDSFVFSHTLMSQPLQESKKYGSLSSFHHQRETSAPSLGHFPAHSQESVSCMQSSVSTDSKLRQSDFHRSSSSSTSESSSQSHPKSPLYTQVSGNTHYGSGHREFGQVPELHTKTSVHHPTLDSLDSVFTDENVPERREGVSSSKSETTELLNRRISMRKAFGIFDDAERVLSTGQKENVIKGRNPPVDGSHVQKLRSSISSDTKLLGQIREVNENDALSVNDGSDSRQRQDSWRDELERRTGYMKRTFPEQVHDRNDRMHQGSTRRQRVFDASIDSGVGSEISSRADYCITSSISADARDLKKQQDPLGNFVYMASKSPDSSHESASHSSESVSDLISKTNENLAKRADSFRRSSTSSSRNSVSDYTDVSRQERSRKETEWSRLRSSGSFLYGSDTTERPSNRSSTSSENAYEDISVFSTPTPHGSLLEITKELEANTRGDKLSAKADETSSMESSVIASPTYQNLSSLRRPPPPPPRSPSPEPHPPPALPPRSYSQKPANSDPASQILSTSMSTKDEEGSTEEARRCVKSLVNQWESNSPREDAYAAQLRKQAMKLSGQRGPASGAVPSTMSVIHSRTQMGISTSYKREPMVAQEATQPVPNNTTVQSVSPCSSMSCISSSTEQRDPPSVLPVAETSISTPHLTQPKDSSNASFTERDSKSVPGAFPQVSERTRGLSWGEQHTPSRKTDGSPHKGQHQTPRDRSHSDKVHQRDSASSPSSQDAFSPFSQDTSRERSASDTRIFSHEKAKEDRLPLSSQRHLDSSSSTSLKGNELGLIGDPGDLPPPPPDLNDNSSSPGKESQADEKYADDSYAAYKNRSSRQVGIYKRSSSAAVIRQNSDGNSEGADTSTFGDRRLGTQSWNSETHLLAANRHDTFRSDKGADTDGANLPERPPDRPINVPAFKADSGPAVRSVTKVTGGPQPLQARHQHSRTRSPQSHSPTARGGGSGGSFVAQPYAAASHSQSKGRQDEGQRQSGGAPLGASVTSTSVQQSQSRSLVDHGTKLERKESFTSGPPTPVPSSNRTASPSHRWANVVPFEATHHLALSSESVNRGSGSNEQASSKSRAGGHSDSNSVMEHVSSGSFPLPVDSPERSRLGKVSNTIVGIRPDPRADKAGPPLSGVETSHKKKALASPGDGTRAVSGFYNRRESAPPPPSLIPRSSPRESPRRQSEGSFLPSRQEADKRGVDDLADTSVSHGRQPSQEELECDQKALELAREVADSEKKLSDVLSADMASTRMKYIHGLFSGPDGSPKRTAAPPLSSRSPSQNQDMQAVTEEEAKVDNSQKKNSLPREYFVSPNKAMLQMEWRNNEEVSKDLTRNIQDNETLIKQKEELIEKLYKKLEALKEERKSLQGEIDENNGLGKRVRETVEVKCSSASERDKFCTVVDDLEKIVRLLLNLSGQLARAENAVQALTENVDPKLRKMTLDKREKLQTKHEEAQQLKEDIDKRTEIVSTFLRQSLSAEEHSDYTYFIKMKSKLTIDLQELEDKITLGEEQIQELKKSIPDKPLSVSAVSSSAPSSPSSSPVPS